MKIHEAQVWDYTRPSPFDKMPTAQEQWDDVLRIYDGWTANIDHLRPEIDATRRRADHWAQICALLCERLGVKFDDVFWADDLAEVSRICDGAKS